MEKIIADIKFGFNREIAACRRGLDYATEWLNYRLQHKPYEGQHRATRKMAAMEPFARVALRWNKTPLLRPNPSPLAV